MRRIPSEDLDFVVTAINVQREVGGPLAEILDTIAFTIRERIRIKGEIRVMTSQVVMSGRILSAVPFVVFIIPLGSPEPGIRWAALQEHRAGGAPDGRG